MQEKKRLAKEHRRHSWSIPYTNIFQSILLGSNKEKSTNLGKKIIQSITCNVNIHGTNLKQDNNLIPNLAYNIASEI